MGKTAVVIPYYFTPPRNGGHHAAYGFCEALGRVREVVVVSSRANPAQETPFRIERLFSERFYKYFSPVIAWRLWRFFRRERIEVCIVQQPFMGLLLWWVCWAASVKLVVYAHNIEWRRFRTIGKWWWRLVYPVERWVYRAADQVLFISPNELPVAIADFGLHPERCTPVPYGTRRQAPSSDRAEARQQLMAAHGYPPDTFLMLFFGPQHYRPNLDAVERILHHINPVLLQRAQFSYRIIICGGGLPQYYNQLQDFKQYHIEYHGFVANIDTYIKAADVALNPITTGGGVKTKIIEAIAQGTAVVSARTGALGVDVRACASHLIIVDDFDYQGFANAIIQLQAKSPLPVPASFYRTCNWKYIIQKADII